MKKGKKTGIIILIAAMLMIITVMDTWLVFRMTARQTRESGSYQLENISREFENTISNAEKLTMSLGIMAEQYIGDEQAMSDFIYDQIDKLVAQDIGVFNVYIVGSDWKILPGLPDPDNFDAKDRDWYKGAAKNMGSTYVTSPYTDVVTGEVCYTVSAMLADGDTVISVDYTMNTIQNYINRMYAAGSGDAAIMTEDGVIVGCSEEEYLGHRITTAYPEFTGVFSLAKSKEGVVTAKIKKDHVSENLFATRIGSGWCLIIGESDWKLYGNSYIQLFITLGLSLAVFAVIIVLYLLAVRNQKNAENALASRDEFISGITGEIKEPLRVIIEGSGKTSVEAMDDYEESFARIHSAGEHLSDMIGQMMSYSSIVRSEKKNKKEKRRSKHGVNKYFRTVILLFMIAVMIVSLYSNISATWRWGNELMKREVSEYEYQVAEWVNTQKSLLDMFCSEISARPEMLDDYDNAVEYLRRVTEQYPEISVTYMSNPELNPSVYMNNGWKPEPGWDVTERPWYKDALASENGWSISAPYFDDQTGGYCITFSQCVNDSETGEFLGVFGIDFYMEKLVEILGGSYSDTGYAFLVDPLGEIVNHPFGSYQMSQDGNTSVTDSPYSGAKTDSDSTTMIRDYDGTLKILAATKNESSSFSVYVVASVWKIYGKVVIYGLICLAAFLLCIILVYRLLTDLIRWQDETNRQMQEAADSAIEAGKAKSQFLAQMSHEIRTPINAVLGMNEMILRESKDPDILDYASNIQSAGRTLLSIINSILDFSKIEDGKMEILPVKYDVADMIHNLYNSVSERAKEKSLDVNVEVDHTIPSSLMGDDVRITQVIMNLLTNAVKYTESGSITLIVKVQEQTEDAVTLFVEVKDTGIGIREEDMDKLFASFERIEEKRNRNIEGTGLGMSIVTKLLEMMDSKLEVKSVYGEGSTFYFSLKQGIVDSKPIGDFKKRVESHARLSAQKDILYTPDARILITDDNEMNLKVAKSLLKLNGVVPDICMSGAECIEQVKTHNYDIIFLDHMMPKMDGIETLAKLNEDKLLSPETHVIALTANAVVGAKEKYIAAGFEDYLSKPIEITKLEEMLKKYLPEDKISVKTEEASVSETSEDEDDELFMFLPEEGDQAEPVMPSYSDISELPAVDGLDWNFASDHLPSVQFIVETVNDFRNVITSQESKLSGFYDGLPDAEAMHEYRIQAHAMQSAAATIGIIPLAGMAKVLEDAAATEDAETIGKLHPVFTKLWLSYKDKLAPLAPEETPEEEKQAFDKEKTDALLRVVREAMEEFDVDRADSAMKELLSFAYPDAMKEKIEQLSVAVTQVDDETAISLTEELLK